MGPKQQDKHLCQDGIGGYYGSARFWNEIVTKDKEKDAKFSNVEFKTIVYTDC